MLQALAAGKTVSARLTESPSLHCHIPTRSLVSTSNLGIYEREYCRGPYWLGDKIKVETKKRKRRICAFVRLIVFCKKREAAGALVLRPTLPLWSGSLRLTVAQELDVSGKSPLTLSTWGLTRRFVHHLY